MHDKKGRARVHGSHFLELPLHILEMALEKLSNWPEYGTWKTSLGRTS